MGVNAISARLSASWSTTFGNENFVIRQQVKTDATSEALMTTQALGSYQISLAISLLLKFGVHDHYPVIEGFIVYPNGSWFLVLLRNPKSESRYSSR
jgi:hypothetical protein